MRCRTTASFRARATLALHMPARLAMRAAQLFSAEPLTGRVRMMCAASYSAVRTPASPILLMRPLRPHRGISQKKLPLYLGFFEFVHNARRRGKALLAALVAALVT